MILALDANGLVRTMYHMSETHDPADAVERFLNRLCHLKDWAEPLADKIGEGLQLIACFDCEGPCFRHQIFPEYKQNRPLDLNAYEAVSHASEALVNSDDWTMIISQEGYEADDLIASIAYQRKYHERVLIHSADKDFNQCLHQDRVGIIKKSGIRDVESNPPELPVTEFFVKRYTAKMLEDDFGFSPRYWVSYQCMVGDSADNITGAFGVGEVKAKAILQEHPWDIEPGDPKQYALNKRQAAHWPDFLERLDALRRVFTLKKDLKLEQQWTSIPHSRQTT